MSHKYSSELPSGKLVNFKVEIANSKYWHSKNNCNCWSPAIPISFIHILYEKRLWDSAFIYRNYFEINRNYFVSF